MANMASVSYVIEGPKEILETINNAIVESMQDKQHWNEWKTCDILGFTEEELEGKRLGGEIEDEPSMGKNTMEFYAEERWGLQDFEELLRQKFPNIKVYWMVEEPGCEIYCTNDKESKYFSERVYVDTCIDGVYDSEYFKDEETAYKWLSDLTNGRVKSAEDAEAFNADYEDSDAEDENWIRVYLYNIVED